MKIISFFVTLLLFTMQAACAYEQPLANPAQEAQAELLFRELRCMVCEAESIADSPAEMASDIRTLVRGRIAKGESADSIKAYLASKYGNAILMQPPLTPATYALWFGPLLVLALGAAIAAGYFRKRPQ